MNYNNNQKGASDSLSVILLIGIVLLISASSSVVVYSLFNEQKTSYAGVIVNENVDEGTIDLLYVSSGNSDYTIIRTNTNFKYTLEEVGDSVTVPASNLQFIGVQKATLLNDEERNLYRIYKPSNLTVENLKLPGNFNGVYVDRDDEYSKIETEVINPYSEEVKIESIVLDVGPSGTTLSHVDSDDRPKECTSYKEPLCSVVYVESPTKDGAVTKEITQELPILIGKKDNFDFDKYPRVREGDVIEERHWDSPVLKNGETARFHLYRFQDSASKKQISDTRGEEVTLRIYFSNGKKIEHTKIVD